LISWCVILHNLATVRTSEITGLNISPRTGFVLNQVQTAKQMLQFTQMRINAKVCCVIM